MVRGLARGTLCGGADLDLFRAIDKYAPGDRVSVEVSRLQRRAGGGIAEEMARLSIVLQATDTV